MSRSKHFSFSPFLTSGPSPSLPSPPSYMLPREHTHTHCLCCNFISITSAFFCSVSQANTLGVKLKFLFISNPSNSSCLLVWLILSGSKRERDDQWLKLEGSLIQRLNSPCVSWAAQPSQQGPQRFHLFTQLSSTCWRFSLHCPRVIGTWLSCPRVLIHWAAKTGEQDRSPPAPLLFITEGKDCQSPLPFLRDCPELAHSDCDEAEKASVWLFQPLWWVVSRRVAGNLWCLSQTSLSE